METLRKHLFFVGLSAIQFGFFFVSNCISSLTSPFFYEHLGLPIVIINAAFAVLPLFGIFMIPAVGLFSDRFSVRRFRRRFFLCVGTVLIALTFPVICLSDLITTGTTEPPPKGTTNYAGSAVGLLLSFIAGVGLNFIIAPSRAVVTDIVPAQDQQAANFDLSIISGCGAVCFYICGGVFTNWAYFYPVVFCLSAVILVATTIVTVLVAHESSHPPAHPQPPANDQQQDAAPVSPRSGPSPADVPFAFSPLPADSSPPNTESTALESVEPTPETSISYTIETSLPEHPSSHAAGSPQNTSLEPTESSSLLAPRQHASRLTSCFKQNLPLLLLVLLVFVGMMSWGSLMLNICNWFALNLFHYDSDSPDFSYGVSMGMYALALQAFVHSLFSLLLTFFEGLENLFFCSSYVVQTLAAFALVVADYVADAYPRPPVFLLCLCFVLFSLFGLGNAIISSIPYAILKVVSPPHRFGLNTAFFAIALQLSVGLVMVILSISLLVYNNMVMIFYISAIFSLVTAVLSFPILRFVNPPRRS